MNYHRLPNHEARRASRIWLGLMTICVLLLVLLASKAEAETYLHTGAWSHHIGSDYDYNEQHDLLAVEHENVMAGYFRNLFGDDSALAGYRFTDQWTEHVEASVLVGASYGYRGDCLMPQYAGQRKACPLVVPTVTYTEYRVQPSVFVMGNAVAVSVRWELY